MSVRIGLDIGGTKTAALVVDAAGAPLGHATRPTDVGDPQRLVGSTLDAVDRALRDAGRTREELAAVGVGIPGQVNPVNGTVRLAVNLNLQEPFPLRDILRTRLGVPVALENDVRAAAWGAYRWACAREPLDSLAYLSIGTGIAAGLVLGGQLYRGANGMAGEIGHVVVDPEGPRCTCGATGCLEALAAGPAIAAQATALLADGREITTHEAISLAAAGHPLATQVVDGAAAHLARAVHMLLMAYDVEKVVLGGGVTAAGEAFERPLRRALARLRDGSPLAASMMPDEKVVTIPADYYAGVIGAVFLAPGPTAVNPAGGE